MTQRPLTEAWEARAQEWAGFARTLGHDEFFTAFNWPALARLLPGPGRATLDVGCGEGRVGRELARLGHRVFGVDSSPTLVALAREAGGYERVECCDVAVRLPFERETFDTAVAFMSLHDMDAPGIALQQIARVLEIGGVLCVATVHPLNRCDTTPDDYFTDHRFAQDMDRDGVPMTFESFDRPLEAYTGALADAGFVIEQLREPRPDRGVGGRLAAAATRPYFVHMRCRLEEHRDG
jgi:SAM-dependent methyltransferase